MPRACRVCVATDRCGHTSSVVPPFFFPLKVRGLTKTGQKNVRAWAPSATRTLCPFILLCGECDLIQTLKPILVFHVSVLKTPSFNKHGSVNPLKVKNLHPVLFCKYVQYIPYGKEGISKRSAVSLYLKVGSKQSLCLKSNVRCVSSQEQYRITHVVSTRCNPTVLTFVFIVS